MKYLFCKLSEFSENDYAEFYSHLPEDLKNRVNRYRKVDDRKRSLAGIMLVEKLLVKEGIANPLIEYTEKGAPRLKNGEMYISISHSYEGVAVAVCSSPVGIDIEKVRDIDLALCKKVCTDSEKDYVFSAADESEKMLRFFEVWTAKEAYFKKLGSGITDLKSVCIFELDRSVITEEGYLIQTVK